MLLRSGCGVRWLLKQKERRHPPPVINTIYTHLLISTCFLYLLEPTWLYLTQPMNVLPDIVVSQGSRTSKMLTDSIHRVSAI